MLNLLLYPYRVLRAVLERLFGPRVSLASVPLALLRAVYGNFKEIRLNGRPFTIDLRDTEISYRILILREWEPDVTKFFRRLVRPGDRVIDIGANIGYFTVLFASSVGPTGRVIAIEPERENAALLRKNVTAGSFDETVRVVEAAAGASPGRSRLYRTTSGNRGDHRMFQLNDLTHRQSDKQPDVMGVDVATVDDCARDLGRVDVIKMDIQGYEARALAGMSDTLAKNISVVLVSEFWPAGIIQSGDDPDEYIGQLTAAGFELWGISGDGWLKRIEVAGLAQRVKCGSGTINIVCARRGVNVEG